MTTRRLRASDGWVGALLLALSACGGRFESNDGTGGSGSGGTAGKGGSSSGGSSGKGSGGSSATGGKGGSSGKGGSGAVAGSGATGGFGAVSGSGGNAGSGPCVQGGACAPDGATCTDDACCPCLYECNSGSWQMTACAGCVPPMCPPSSPNDGDPCDPCMDQTGSPCEYDQCPTSKTLATCAGNTWSVEIQGCGFPACCAKDAECGSYICVSTICKNPTAPGCWRDEQCGQNSFCSGSFVCPCAADCAYGDMPGTCVPADAGCCREDSNCPNGLGCLHGVCKSNAGPGLCWSDRECPGKVCKNAQICACGANCLLPDTPGTCG